jgi:hypothetical protein
MAFAVALAFAVAFAVASRYPEASASGLIAPPQTNTALPKAVVKRKARND